MVKIERPESMFGKEPFRVEQGSIIDATKKTSQGVSLIDPAITGIPPIFVRFKTERERLDKMNAFFKEAKRKLEAIGV